MTLTDLQRAVELLPSGSSVTIPRDELLAALKTAKGVRPTPTAAPESQDLLLNAEEVARRMGVRRKYVYAHACEWPFTRHIGNKTLRFSEKGFELWVARQTTMRPHLRNIAHNRIS